MNRLFVLALFAAMMASAPIGQLEAARPLPRVLVDTISINPTPATVGSVVTFTATATPTGGGTLTYQWDFGDGTPLAGFTASTSVTHTYTVPGAFNVQVDVHEGPPANTDTFVPAAPQRLLVHWPLTAVKPTNSSTIILDSTNSKIWCVNADQDTVSSMTTAGTGVTSFSVGKNPRTLAQAADGRIWVVSQQHPSISILNPLTGALEHVIPLPHGSLPYGICMTPDGSAAYVSFQGAGGVWKISTGSRATLATSTVPPSARGIAVSGDGRVLVTRFISPVSNPLSSNQSSNHGEVVELSGSTLATVRTFTLALDPGIPGTTPGPAPADPDFGSVPASPLTANAAAGRGVPNYLTSLVITPDGRRAWVPCKKDNIERGTSSVRDARTPGAEVTYRAIASSLDLVNNVEPALVPATDERIDFKNSEMPQAACVSPLGDFLFVALQGNNKVQIRNLFPVPFSPQAPSINNFGDPTGVGATDGLAPQGIVLDPSSSKLYVHNYMSRTISIMDATNVLNGTATNLPAPTVIPIVPPANDALATVVGTTGGLPVTALQGKQIFYNAADPKMSFASYISCAGCHLDGGSDMRVWDFTNRGEGLRNTIMLQGRGAGAGVGMKHGNVHWTANFDEIQDFENDIQNRFGGTGFSGGAPNPPMGTTNAGRTSALDSLAAYVNSLTKVSRSPFRNADGSLTASGARGEAIFKAQNCQQCHGGREFTDSAIFTLTPPTLPPSTPAPGQSPHDVGTVGTGPRTGISDSRLGNANTRIDTPTLKGLWQTAPYLHDGAATDIPSVFTDVSAPTHFGFDPMTVLSAAQRADLAEYLLEIDELDAPPVPPAQVDTVFLGSVATGRPYSLATAATGRLPFVDRSYAITSALSGTVTGGVLIRTAEDDKSFSGGGLLSFTVPAGTDVFVYLDSRRTSLPSWMSAGWTAQAASENITISPGLTMNAFKMNPQPPAGVVTLGGNQQGGPTGALRNYFVILVNAGAVFEEGPINRGEWAHDRDADGDGLHDEFEAVTAATVAGLSPWAANSVAAGVADEDQMIGGVTLFNSQIAFEAVPPPPGGGGGGGCGLGGFEVLLPMALLRLRRLRSFA